MKLIAASISEREFFAFYGSFADIFDESQIFRFFLIYSGRE